MGRKKQRVFRGRVLTAVNLTLFSVMAELAYIGTIFFTDVLKRCPDGDAFSWWIFVLCPVAFGALCYGLLYLSRIVNYRYPTTFTGAFKSLGFFALMGVAFFGFNYLLYVVTVAGIAYDTGSPFKPTEPITLPVTLISMVELVIMCLISLNQLARYSLYLSMESERSRQAQARSEIKALQSQLNPHFLFNSLNVLIAEIDNDTEAAKHFTIDLAGVYRYILQKQDKPLVTVYDELDFLRRYIRLNRVRVGENLTFECVYPQQSNLDFLQEKFLPSLSLQLLAENALKHNVVSSLKPLKIEVGFSRDLKYIVITNNRNPKKSALSLGTGLNNLSERYRLLAHEEIIIENDEKYFTVKLPMLDGNEAR